ncbi:hypothetical protein D9757_014461 [Collybiopsis confluens]|uniref:Nephrocystin 3-like N-terminal domain-containing protein n=1 Tax=Collybiopsis confluens TaxID=2823264 RepID=A0A8H5CVF6_9AGAR|nr:hypothetical protein D9757_014461 [Collybiopsis confluens]
MGHRGYFIYRYQGHFFVKYLSNGSFPALEGVGAAAEIPRDAAEFEAYVSSKKEALLQRILNLHKKRVDGEEDGDEEDDDDEDDWSLFKIQRELPEKDCFIEWTYEIDLDNYVFHVNEQPVFDLRNMPYGEEFVSYLDGSGRPPLKIPSRYRYKLPAPPPLSPDTLALYQNSVSSVESTHQVLDIPAQMAAVEQVRMTMMQAYIRGSMPSFFPSFELASDGMFPGVQPRIAAICSVFCRPLMLDNDQFGIVLRMFHLAIEIQEPYEWIVESEFCILITQRLDSEVKLQGSVAQLVQNVSRHFERKQTLDLHVFYEVVDRGSGSGRVFTVKHTPALQFIPSPSSTNSYTPGIEALARLGHMVLKRALQKRLIINNQRSHIANFSANLKINELPLEICLQIANHLHPYALLNNPFVTVSRCFAQASYEVMLFPFLSTRDNNWYRAELVASEIVHVKQSSKIGLAGELYRETLVALSLQTSERMLLTLAPKPIKKGRKGVQDEHARGEYDFYSPELKVGIVFDARPLEKCNAGSSTSANCKNIYIDRILNKSFPVRKSAITVASVAIETGRSPVIHGAQHLRLFLCSSAILVEYSTMSRDWSSESTDPYRGGTNNPQLFAGSHDFSITGGTFVAGNLNVDFKQEERGLLLLYQSACTSALFNAEARFPPPLCHPGTRESILDDLKSWIDSPDPSHNIRWLYGPAGAGKSAIAQTLAETCAKDGALVGTFFFWRSDSSRNNPRQLVTTIAFQLLLSIPGLRAIVNTILLENPSILTSSIETQFDEFILKPCIELQRISEAAKPSSRNQITRHSRVLILDGLDECLDTQDQLRVLSILGKAIERGILPFRVFIASRPEPRIKEAFVNPPFDHICVWTCLNDQFQASRDIRRYLQQQFRNILKRHSLTMEHIPRPWPTPGQIERLVEKASGQFIYPSVVLKFINDDGAVPANRLDVVLGLAPSGDIDSPYADLDALYIQILSAAVNKRLLLRILGILLVHQEMKYQSDNNQVFLRTLIQLPLGTLRATLSKLHSLFLEPAPIESGFQFSHASFADFLLDPNRSKQFFIDLPIYHDYMAQLCLNILLQHPFHIDDIFSYAKLYWDGHCVAAISAENNKIPSSELVSKLSTLDVYTVAERLVVQQYLLYASESGASMGEHWIRFLKGAHRVMVSMQIKREQVFLRHFHDISMKGFRFEFSTCTCSPWKSACPDSHKHQERQVFMEFSSAFDDRSEIGLSLSWQYIIDAFFECHAVSDLYKLSGLSTTIYDESAKVENVWK